MRFFAPIALLASLALTSAAVLPEKRDILSTLGVQTGTNAESTSSTAWIGTGGAYTGDFINSSGEEITLVIWGPAGSWVNVDAPLITKTLASGATTTISFANGLSGAWSALYTDTTLVNGQVFNTWGEFTFNGEFSTFDVTREVNMGGHNMSIESTGCTSNMDTCVFTCDSGNSCEFDYSLINCATGSQTGAEYGTYDGAASGGCLVGGTSVTTTFS